MKKVDKKLESLISKIESLQEEFEHLKYSIEEKRDIMEEKFDETEDAKYEERIDGINDDIGYLDEVYQALDNARSEIENYIEF